MEALLGSHREPSYTSRVSRLLGIDGESVFLSSISDSFSDAERTLKILGHFTPILAEYVVTMRQVNALREAHGDDDEAYRKARDDVLDAQHERAGPRVGAMYDDLGSVYLKTAQFAAAQGSLLPAAFERHLQFAFENARKRPWSAVDATVASDLGRCYREAHFLRLDEAPLAAASIGQVHLGCLKEPQRRRGGGKAAKFQDVAVKVIYDDVRRNLVQDLKNQRILCEQVNVALELHMDQTIAAILDEVEANLPLELDFGREIANMDRAAALFKKRGYGDVVIPTAVPKFSSESVLVMEFLKGRTLATYAKAPPRHRQVREDVVGVVGGGPPAPPPAKEARTAVKRNLLRVVDAIGATLFLDGFFHADAHPGNVLVLDDASHRVALIDWGQCAELRPHQVAGVARLVLLLNARSPELLDACFESPGLAGALADRYSFSNLAESGLDAAARTALLYQFFDTSSGDLGDAVDAAVFDEIQYMIQHDISNVPMFTAVPAEVIFYGRTVSALRRCLRALDMVQVSVVERWAPFARQALRAFIVANPTREDLPYDLARGADHLLLALPLDKTWLRRGKALLEDDRVPARIRAAASDCIARERGKLDADPERYFRGLLDGPRLRARLFRLATSDDLHLWALPKADALLRTAATCLADDATARRAALAAATAAVAGGAALAGLAFSLLRT